MKILHTVIPKFCFVVLNSSCTIYLTPEVLITIAVVECLTQDRGAAGSSLTSVAVLCPLARHFYPCLVLLQPRNTCTNITEKVLTER